MSRREIGQEGLTFAPSVGIRRSSLDELTGLIEWAPLARQLDEIHSVAKGEPAWPPLALFKALLISVWYDLSDVKLAEALEDRASLKPSSGRYLSFAEREELAILHAWGAGVCEIARQLGRWASTISRELRRNAATRGGG
jgi:Helix-turn-helix domain/Transposase domain (DUF772)